MINYVRTLGFNVVNVSKPITSVVNWDDDVIVTTKSQPETLVYHPHDPTWSNSFQILILSHTKVCLSCTLNATSSILLETVQHSLRIVMLLTRDTNLMRQLWFIIINISTCFGHLYAHLQKYRLYVTAYGVQHCKRELGVSGWFRSVLFVVLCGCWFRLCSKVYWV